MENYEKNYKEALERAKELQENSNGMILKKWLWKVFPELKESEDERIIEEIICFILDKADTYELREKSNSWLSYLEEQGEQKSAEKISVSEELYEHIRNAYACMEDANCSDEELKPKHKQDRYDQAREDLEEAMKLISVEQKPIEWSEEDENMLQSILDEYKSMMPEKRDWLTKRLKYLKPQKQWKPSKEQMVAYMKRLKKIIE